MLDVYPALDADQVADDRRAGFNCPGNTRKRYEHHDTTGNAPCQAGYSHRPDSLKLFVGLDLRQFSASDLLKTSRMSPYEQDNRLLIASPSSWKTRRRLSAPPISSNFYAEVGFS
jgi:hypothetical protein